ncbi:LuxR C-terminal-related transcriptional regulator [Nonomuraea sp. NPDC050556]|uniref:LuxR C-terminal-related transcriptional regulator n=1 Tax=Nonomuraea sp. NPDC050556 TaxID=3364369 RepID=UPI0037A798D7
MWPFYGRAAQVATIRSADSGIVVAGAPGAGKSRLVAHAVDGAAWVRATEAAAELPLGAFASLLPATPPEGNPLGWAAAAIQTPVLVVDDAHLLDSASAALLHHLVVRRRTKVIATVRSETRAPDAVQALWKDDLLPRLDLAPLSAEETTGLLERALGGRIEPSAADRLWRASQGNALYLRELVLSGLLSDATGIWRWRGAVKMTPSLRQTIADRIGEITAEEREVLELLAYGEPLGADLLAGLGSAGAVEELEDRQLVTVEHDGKRLNVRLAHPLYGEVIRAGCGVLRSRKLMRRLADTVTTTGLHRREDLLRVAVWRLDSGVATDPDLLIAGCDRAKMIRDLELAAKLGRAAVDAGGGPRALYLLGMVLFYANCHEEAEDTYARLWEMDMPEEVRLECGVSRCFNLLWGLGRIDAARAVLDETERAVTSVELVQAVYGTRSTVAYGCGDLDAAWDWVARGRALGPLPPRGVLAHGATESIMLALSGRPRECLQWVAEATVEFAKAPHALPSLTAVLKDAASHASLQLGELDNAERYADEGYRLDGDFGTWTRVILQFGARKAEISRLRGRLRDALAWAKETATRLPPVNVMAGLCLGELAHAHALLGDVAAAEAVLEQAERRHLPVGPYETAGLRFARAWTLAARGDLAGAVAESLAHAGEALPCHAAFALHDVVRLGQPELVDGRISGEGPLIALFARHALARDGSSFEAVSKEFEALGLILYAAEASARAATRYRDEGLSRAARAAETRAWMLSRRCQGARTLPLLDLDVPGLTPRQREIAILAAQGLTNREIAERLYVSIRTVSNTLVAVYERTGVNDRAALAELLDQALPPGQGGGLDP